MGRMVNNRRKVYCLLSVAVAFFVLSSGCGNPLIEAIQEDVKAATAPALPEIEVTYGIDRTVLPSGGIADFDTCFVGYTKQLIFEVKNVGSSSLVIPTIDPVVLNTGTVFSIDLPPQNIPQAGILKPGDKLSFNAVFEPLSTGVTQDEVTITSNDPDEGTYTFTVEGTGMEAGTIAVPNGGESYRPGDVCTITWGPLVDSQIDPQATVEIEYSAGGGAYVSIIDSTPDDGEHEWTIPDDGSVEKRADYKIKITSIQYANIFTESQGYFAIGIINLTAPNGGEEWQRGTTKNITWTSELGGTVSIELLKGGALSQTIASNVSNNQTNSFPWPISGSQTLDDDYRIRIKLDSNAAISDTSDADFAVFGGRVSTPDISPNTGTYGYAPLVTISSSTPGATIRYTLDGSTPTKDHGTIYTAGFRIRSNYTVRAMAYLNYWWDSYQATPSTFTIRFSSQVDKVVASNSATDDNFGSAVTIDGDFLFVGAPRKSSSKGSAYFFRRTTGDDFGTSIEYIPGDVSAPDYYGRSVDVIEEEYVIIGASQQDSAKGATYIYSWNSTGFWNSVPTRIEASDAQNLDYFGTSVALSPDRTYAIVGAHFENGGAGDPITRAGAAYVFRRDQGNTWYQNAKLTSSDPAANEFFGGSVAIFGNYAIVGCYGDAGNKGAAYIFQDDGKGNWAGPTKITASDGEAGDYFGYPVAISGDYAVVGAYAEDGGNGNPQSNAGCAYVFRRTTGNTWIQSAKLTAFDQASNDNFGISVAIDGDYILVGAEKEDETAADAGAAYIFYRTGTDTWSSGAKLLAADGQAYDYFGSSVDIKGGYAAVGADNVDFTGKDNAGAAYIFK